MFERHATQASRRATVAWQTFHAQPSWIARATIAVFVIIIAIPAIVLMLFALLAASAAFMVLWAIARVATLFRRVMPRDDGRENVRVIQPRRH